MSRACRCATTTSMTSTRTLCLLAVFAAPMVACAAEASMQGVATDMAVTSESSLDSTSHDSESTSSVGPDTAGIAITVVAAHEAEVGPLAPVEGQTHIVLDVEVDNGGDTAHLVSPVVFWVAGSDGLERVASPLTDLLAEGCPSDAQLSPGGSTACQLVFVVPTSVTPEHLLYRDGTTSAEATVPEVTPCDRCDGRCVDLSSDPNNCGACGRLAPTASSCVAAQVVCNDTAALACDEADGTIACVVPNTPEHCGGCGIACDALPGAASECSEGACLYPSTSFFGDCNFICAQFGLECAFSDLCGAQDTCAATSVDGCQIICYCAE